MSRARKCLLVGFIVLLVVASSACIGRGKKKNTGPANYITPCNVVGERVLIKAEGAILGPEIIKDPLAESFVDDIISEQARDAYDTYTISCWWAKNIGEKLGLYYCGGNYVVTDVDEKGVIRRYINKEFKIGFHVESREGVSFVIRGKTHTEPPYHLLTVKEVSATCRVN